MCIMRKIGKFILCVVLPVMWLLFIHVSAGFSNPWIDFSINKILEILMKSVLIIYISGTILKLKNKKCLFMVLSLLISFTLAFLLPYLDKLLWAIKEINLPLISRFEIANYIYIANNIAGKYIISNMFWFLFFVGVLCIQYFRKKIN